MSDTYDYDVFISYSSADRPWAIKLYESLQEKGIKPFLDQKRLDVGKPWEPALAKAVQTSQHLIVLWSDHAEQSRWVGRELGVFEAIVDPALGGHIGEDRRFIFLMLEGENPAYTSMQTLSDLREANAYAGGADAVEPGCWQGVVKKLVDAIRANDPSVPLPVVVLAMTQQELGELDPNEKPDFGSSVNTLLHDVGIGTIEALAQYYGPQRTDWRPFGSQLNIQQILDNLLDAINLDITQKKNPSPPFRWAPIENDFWTDLQAARGQLPQFLSSRSVIVIDPIALYHERIYRRLVLLSKCFESEKAIIMVLTPFLMPPPLRHLNTLVEQRGTPFFDTYYSPPVPYNVTSATLGVNISDEKEVKRLLRVSLGQQVYSKGPALPPPPYLRQ